MNKTDTGLLSRSFSLLVRDIPMGSYNTTLQREAELRRGTPQRPEKREGKCSTKTF